MAPIRRRGFFATTGPGHERWRHEQRYGSRTCRMPIRRRIRRGNVMVMCDRRSLDARGNGGCPLGCGAPAVVFGGTRTLRILCPLSCRCRPETCRSDVLVPAGSAAGPARSSFPYPSLLPLKRQFGPGCPPTSPEHVENFFESANKSCQHCVSSARRVAPRGISGRNFLTLAENFAILATFRCRLRTWRAVDAGFSGRYVSVSLCRVSYVYANLQHVFS